MSENSRYCVHCGVELDPDQRFCHECGAPVWCDSEAADGEAATCGQDGSRGTVPIPVVASSQVPVVSEAPAAPYYEPRAQTGGTAPMPLVPPSAGPYADQRNTQVMEPIAAPPKQYRQQGAASGRDTKRTALIVVIVVLAAILVVLVGVLAFNSMQAGSSASPATSSADDSAAEPSAQSQDASSEDEADDALSQDQAYYDELVVYYDRLGSFDADIADTAEVFNSMYMNKSLDKRSDASEAAHRLMDEISEEYAALQALAVPSSSECYESYSDMLTCYYDCLMRIDVICQAWEKSLSYSDPTGHSDEICEPLARDRVDGTNKYLTEFKELYPSAKPTQPRG